MGTLGFAQHDHSHCVSTAVKEAQDYCKAKGLQLTPVRKRTLEILLEEHRALGAYDVLARLSEEGFGTQPPVAYRALSFLTDNGFAHKVEKLNAFIACVHPGENHTPVFLICTECDTVAESETTSTKEILSNIAQTTGFDISRAVLEAEGTCPACQKEGA